MKLKFSKALTSVLLGAAALSTPIAFAHGVTAAQHGGVVQSAGDLSFELVSSATGATIYVDDHDDAYDTKKMAGKLTVLNGADKSEAELTPGGGNKLEAKGVKVSKGAKVVAALTEGRKTMTVRFTVK
ncbi:hypothetical protein ACSFA8_26450 [Variovorax sp. RT4R15]|uniref:hypothetical protein n=1 Tax=Variovorax sp. RT4R15 TaxID=3443737 RepID=UPI003F48E8F5